MATVSFASDIKPLFAQFVAQMRWRLDLTSYEDVRANFQMIRSVIDLSPDNQKPMPPPPFDPLTPEQVAMFQSWIDQGFPA